MNAGDLVRLVAYRVWARERVLTAVSQLPAADYLRPVVSSFPSVRATLVHVLSADVVWTARLGGVSPGGHLQPDAYADVAALRARWEHVDPELAALVAGSEPERMVEYSTTAGLTYRQPVWQIVQHLVNHQTYHLGQVATLIRQLGGSAPAIDLILYDREGWVG